MFTAWPRDRRQSERISLKGAGDRLRVYCGDSEMRVRTPSASQDGHRRVVFRKNLFLCNELTETRFKMQKFPSLKKKVQGCPQVWTGFPSVVWKLDFIIISSGHAKKSEQRSSEIQILIGINFNLRRCMTNSVDFQLFSKVFSRVLNELFRKYRRFCPQFLTFRGSSFTFWWVDVKSTLVGLEAKLEKVVLRRLSSIICLSLFQIHLQYL